MQRDVLPMPDQPHDGLITYDAKDPDTSFPPIEPLRPPAGAPNVLVVLLDDAGFGSSSAFGGPMLDADGGASGRERAQVQPLPHNRALLADAPGAADGTQPPLRRHGRHHRDRHARRLGYNSVRPNTAAPLAETLKLNGYSTAQFGKCHEVPVWETSPLGPFDAWPTGGGGFEHFYGFIGGETNQYAPALYDGTTPDRAGPHAGGGLPPHRGHDRPGDRLGPTAEGADARQAVLRLLRARGHARAAPCAARVVRQVQGPLRRRLGRAARGDLRAAAGARRDPARGRADRQAGGDPGLGRHARSTSSRCSRARWRSTRVSWSTPTITSAGSVDALRGPRGPRRHADLLHRRRQRRLGRRNPAGHVQRDDQPQRRGRDRDDRVHGRADRPVRHDRRQQPLRGRLGARDGHPVPVDEAGRLPLGRHPQRHRRPTGPAASRPEARCARSSAT